MKLILMGQSQEEKDNELCLPQGISSLELPASHIRDTLLPRVQVADTH